MKKLLTVILILAMILPAAALADVSSWLYEATWVHTDYGKSGGVTIEALCLNEDGTAFYVVQSFTAEEPMFGRAFVGSWEISGPDTIHVIIGNNAEMEMCYSSYNMMYDVQTRSMFFRSAMGKDDVFP